MRTARTLLLFVAGCFGPQAQVGLPCSPSGECPEGQECAPDGTCQLSGFSLDSGSGDGGPSTPDGMPIPLEPWLISFQHPNNARSSDVARAGGGFVMVGYHDMVAINPLGEVLWHKKLNSEGTDFAYSVVGVPGGMVMAGQIAGGMWAVGLDQAGDVRWAKRYTDQEDSSAWSVAAVPGTGHVVLIGYSVDSADVRSPWLVRVNDTGAIVWQKRFALAGGAQATGGTATSDGGFVAIGHTDGDRDLIVFKVDQEGSLVWQKRIDGGENDWGTSAAEGPGGELLLTGGTWSGSFGGADLWFIRLREDGAIKTQHRIGSDEQDIGTDVFATGPDGALLVGETAAEGDTDLWAIEVKGGVIARQVRVGTSAASERGGGAAQDSGGLVLFGDSDAFGNDYGFFAASVFLSDDVDPGCPHTTAAAGQMAPSEATASNTSFAVTTTSASATDIAAATTPIELGLTAECE